MKFVQETIFEHYDGVQVLTSYSDERQRLYIGIAVPDIREFSEKRQYIMMLVPATEADYVCAENFENLRRIFDPEIKNEYWVIDLYRDDLVTEYHIAGEHILEWEGEEFPKERVTETYLPAR